MQKDPGLLPIDEVVRTENRRAGRVVHIGCGVVKNIADAKDIDLREVFPQNRILEF